MKRSNEKIKIGILGCGAIGSGIAKSIFKELKEFCELTALHDTDRQKAIQLEKSLPVDNVIKDSLAELLESCDLMVEAVNAKETATIIRQAIEAQKDVLAMSTGKLLNASDLFELANKCNSCILLPSGAIAGIDAIKAASLRSIEQITLTTRKPPTGFEGNPYIQKKGMDLSKVSGETIIFEGNVDDAVTHFPKNINVAATLSLASRAKEKLVIRIITSPDFKNNSHEIEVRGDFGCMTTKTENVICPDNPKTSYLAVLSGIASLKGFCSYLKVGT